MAGLNNLDGSRSVFVPTEFQADFGPEVGGDAWSADLLVFNNPSPMEKSRLLLWAQDSAKHCSHVDCVIEQFSLRTESKAWRTSPPARPSDGFPLEFDVSVDGLHDQFPPAVPNTAFDLATAQAATHGQGKVSVKAAVH